MCLFQWYLLVRSKHYDVCVSVLFAVLALLLLLPDGAVGQCGSSCGACARRYGCMTPAWGKCCTQFFMHNGKRSSPADPNKKPIENFIEYIRMKSKIINVSKLKHSETIKINIYENNNLMIKCRRIFWKKSFFLTFCKKEMLGAKITFQPQT